MTKLLFFNHCLPRRAFLHDAHVALALRRVLLFYVKRLVIRLSTAMEQQ
jgi:hypothetical protein